MLPGSNLEGIIASFSPCGESFALSTPDGKVRTYDTGNGRLRASLGEKAGTAATVPNGHLVEKHTCIAWAPARKVKKHQEGQGSSALLAVGSTAGDVKVFDVKLGELSWRSNGVLEGGVASIAASPKQGLLHVSGPSGWVVQLDVQSGSSKGSFQASKHSVTCVAIAPDCDKLLCGGSSLSLWPADGEERTAKFTGHPSAVRAMAFSPDGKNAVSAALGERQVAVWSTAPGKKSKKMQTAVLNLSMDEPAVQLDTCSASSSSDGSAAAFYVSALSESGEVYVWLCQEQESGLAPQLACRVRVTSTPNGVAAAGHQECILGAKLQAGSKGPMLLIARGSSAKPTFDKVTVPAWMGEAAIINLQPSNSGVLLTSKAAAASQPSTSKSVKGEATVLGPDNMGQPLLVRAADGAGSRKRPEPEAEAASVDEDEEDLDEANDEAPLGERLEALEARAAGSQPQEEAGPSTAGPRGSAQADSLSVLLTQALRSNDRALLEKCLATSNLRIINNTVKRIVPMDAALFLRAAVDRVLSKPARAAQLAPWIKAVMMHHTGYMMTAPGMQAPLVALYQAIEARASMYQSLLKTYGRLGLVTAHAKAGAEGSDEDEDDGLPPAEVTFEDAEEEDVEVEDPFAPGAGGSEDDSEGDSEGMGDGEDLSEGGMSDEDMDGDEDDDEL